MVPVSRSVDFTELLHVIFVGAYVLSGIGFVLFVFVIFFGAPYLPTLKKRVPDALDLIHLRPGDTLLELGSGDGRVLVEAAKRGINSVGYELNPLLAAFSWVRTRKYEASVRVVCGNYWNKKLPKEADGIFVFLLQPYMEKLDKKITQTYKHKRVKLVSFAFDIPGREVKKEDRGLNLYIYDKGQ